MNDIFRIILFLSLSGSVLILAVLLACRVLGRRLGMRWQYYIWVLVALRLLIPFSPAPALLSRAARSERFVSISDSLRFEEIENGMNRGLMTPEQVRAAGMRRSVLPMALSGLSSLWVAGAAGLMIRKITVYQSFAKYVKAGSAPVEDIDRLNFFGAVCTELNIGGSVELCTNRLIASPLIVGILRPHVVLPASSVPTGELRYIYLHELIHLKRKDILYKWLLQLVLCLHWFNPLVHYMIRRAGRLCELSCDEAVIRLLDSGERKDYGAVLLQSLRNANAYREPIAALTLCESALLLQERLTAIASPSPPRSAAKALAVGLSLCLAGAGLALGAYPLPASGSFAAAPPNPLQEKSPLADDTALMLIETGGANAGVWYIIGYMIPYMTNAGVDAAVERFNEEYPGERKAAAAYYDLPVPSREESSQRAYEIMRRTGNFLLFEPLLPYLAPGDAQELIAEYRSRMGDDLPPRPRQPTN